MIIGLTGVAGAGKDTVYERLAALDSSQSYVKMSVADALKESVSALFGISLDHLEELKRDQESLIKVTAAVDAEGTNQDPIYRYNVCEMSMREFLQRYGTEAHRGVFGQDFWLDVWEARVRDVQAQQIPVRDWQDRIVNTSVRFPNEAERIIALGGEVWEVIGPQDAGAGGHASEQPLDKELTTHTIDNHYRGTTGTDNFPDFSYLDEQLEELLR
jgi:hypothetical protein